MVKRTYIVKIRRPLLAPYKHTKYIPLVKYVLQKKYNSKWKHVDKAFDRWIIDDENEPKPVIYGNTVYGAIKRALNKAGVPCSEFTVEYMSFPEDSVVLYQHYITNGNGNSVVNVEMATPGTEAILVGDLTAIEHLLPLTIQLGGRRKFGFGIAEIWES